MDIGRSCREGLYKICIGRRLRHCIEHLKRPKWHEMEICKHRSGSVQYGLFDIRLREDRYQTKIRFSKSMNVC